MSCIRILLICQALSFHTSLGVLPLVLVYYTTLSRIVECLDHVIYHGLQCTTVINNISVLINYLLECPHKPFNVT